MKIMILDRHSRGESASSCLEHECGASNPLSVAFDEEAHDRDSPVLSDCACSSWSRC